MIRNAALALTLASVAAGATAADLSAVPDGTYALDDSHGYIYFSYSHLGFSRPMVRFREFDLTLELDTESPEDSTLEVVIDANSIDTGVALFDEHMKARETLLETAVHPRITYTATSIRMTGSDTAEITGDLTVKGITRPVTLDVRLNKAANHPMNGKPALGFSGSASIKRSAWGLDYAIPAVSDEVEITLETELFKAE
jgi:polyisoprenoid-binding protein YceI